MNTIAPPRSLLAVLLALWLAAAATAQTRPPPDQEQLQRKLQSTSTLIETSSGARQIEASGVAAAQAERNRARELHGRAGEALRAGDLEAAARLLDEASRAMFQGVRQAAPEQVTEAKERADFKARLESTRALLDAQKRIATEKGGAGAGETARQTEALLAEAERMAGAGRLADARRPLEQAYLTVKVAIGNARGGDTLVRSLNFETPVDEYHYEIDRNDTHRMLVQMLLKDRRSGPVDAMVEQAVASSARLRAQAEAEAARNDHKAAIRTLEDSTRDLVRAIRAAGVYIPG